MYQDRSGTFWIGTESTGLNQLLPPGPGLSGNNSERSPLIFIRHQYDPNDPNSISHNRIKTIYEDSKGVLWIGTWGGGFNRLAGILFFKFLNMVNVMTQGHEIQ